VDWRVCEKYPLFPVAMSHGMPFLLIAGYNGSGYSDDTADKCLQLCEALPLIPRDLSDGDYEKGAQELVESDDFKKLYLDTNVLIHVEKMIFRQAQHPDTIKRFRQKVKSSINVEIRDTPQTNN